MNGSALSSTGMTTADSPVPGTPTDPEPPGRAALTELLAAAAHEGWMASKRAQGITSRLSEWGEEFMVPYGEMSERAKDIDRGAVSSVLDAIDAAGLSVVSAREIARQAAALNEAQLRSIEARNPGIDMDEVRRIRARAGVSPQPETEDDVLRVAISICRPCLAGVGEECHTPGCALYMHRVDLPIYDGVYEVLTDRPQPEITRQQIADTLDHVFNEVLRTQYSGSWFRTGRDRIDLAADAVWALLADGATPAGPEATDG